MTAHTGHDLVRSGIKDLFAHGMAEFALGFVAAGTGLIPAVLEHGKIAGSVDGMALLAIVGLRMNMEPVVVPCEGPLVAWPADLFLPPPEEVWLISGVGAVTGGAAVAFHPQKMAVGGADLCIHFFVALEAEFHAHVPLAVTGTAPLLERGVEIVADQGAAAASVGGVARETVVEGHGIAGMGLPDPVARMTGDAYGIGFTLEQLRIARFVGFVARRAISLGKRGMGIFVSAGQVLVTPEAGLREACVQKVSGVGGMGLVTGETLALAHGLVNDFLGPGHRLRQMAGVTEPGPGFLEQTLVPRHMGVVTAPAFPLRHWPMHDLFLKGRPFVTLEADVFTRARSGEAQGQAYKDDRQGAQKGLSRLHLVPPG